MTLLPLGFLSTRPRRRRYARRVPIERDVLLASGRSLHVFDTETVAFGAPALFWFHGSPQSGAPLGPLVELAAARGIRLVSYARPSYGGSTPRPGRDVASAAADVAAIADDLGIERFSVMGASGGGPHALACAALLPERVVAAVTLAGIAPLTDEYDWFAGMVAPGGLRAALSGRQARATFAESDEFDPESFIPADYVALDGDWRSLGADAGAAGEAWPDGIIDDDVAFVTPWGFELSSISSPVLVVQGGLDRVVPPTHGEWMQRQIPRAEFRARPDDGHISVLSATADAMDWLLAAE